MQAPFPSKNSPIAGAIALALVTIFLVSLRFFHPGLVPFILDEPVFQEWANRILETGRWPLVCMGGSSIPVSYGGGAIWLYTIPKFFSASPLAFTLFHTVVYSSSFLFLFLFLRSFCSLSMALGTVALAASSPFLFLFSRHAWDTTFFVPFTIFLLFCQFKFLAEALAQDRWAPSRKSVLCLLGISLIGALAINIQLAIGPFILLVFAVFLFWLLVKERNNPGAWMAIFACGLLMILLCVPYALAALDFMEKNAAIMSHAKHSRWGNARHAWWNLLYILFGLSTWRTSIFFQSAYLDFSAHLGPFLTKVFYLDIFGWLTKATAIVGWGMSFRALVQQCRSGAPWKMEHFAQFLVVAGMLVYLLVFQYLNIPVQPHYFQSAWWLPFLMVALVWRSMRSSRAFATLIALTAAVNVIFVISLLGYMAKNGGVRSMAISTGMMETRAAVLDFCAQARAAGKVENLQLNMGGIAIGKTPVEYFIKTEKECSGIKATVDFGLVGWDYELRYLSERGPGEARFRAFPK